MTHPVDFPQEFPRWEMAWKPISSAPKNKEVLLYHPPVPPKRPGSGGMGEWVHVGYVGSTPNRPPSHYIEIPPPPSL